MRLLLFVEVSRQSRKPNTCIIVIIIVSYGKIAFVFLGEIAFVFLFHLILVSALHVVIRLVPIANKPVLAAWVFFEVLSTALFKLLVTGECQVWARIRYFGAVPTFGAFFAALPIAAHFCETRLAWLLAAAFDHAVLP